MGPTTGDAASEIPSFPAPSSPRSLPTFPNSAWERLAAKLCLAVIQLARSAATWRLVRRCPFLQSPVGGELGLGKLPGALSALRRRFAETFHPFATQALTTPAPAPGATQMAKSRGGVALSDKVRGRQFFRRAARHRRIFHGVRSFRLPLHADSCTLSYAAASFASGCFDRATPACAELPFECASAEEVRQRSADEVFVTQREVSGG